VEVFPTAANFIAFRPERSAKSIFDALCTRGILIRDISSYHGLANCLRVSIGMREENDRFLEALKETA
ncbi:MAG: histidinol-phosphate transaminase, partial [Thermoanaerobaculia bacterium]